MPEKESVFSSKMKYAGIFSFRDFYKFAYDWLKEEASLKVIEDVYEEKIKGVEKEVLIKWTGAKKVTDFFKFQVEVEIKIKNLKEVEVLKEGIKVKTNDGRLTIEVEGILIKDYEGKFETSGFLKFLRGVYEKWIIPSRIDEFSDKLTDICNNFLLQSKEYLDLEGKG